MRVGFIGAGVIGSAMIRCLLQAGHDVTVYDIQREATTEVCKQKARNDVPGFVIDFSINHLFHFFSNILCIILDGRATVR